MDGLKYRLEEMRRLTEIPRSSHPKIQKVANDLRERMDYRSHYLPKVVSMGPIHNGNPELQIGEQYKLIWAQKYIESTGENIEQLYKQVADKLDDLKSCFANNVLNRASNTIGNFSSLDDKLTWMLFVDGCSLLHILVTKGSDILDLGEETIINLVIRDVLLLENQLPFMLLGLLCRQHNLLMKITKDFLISNYFLRGFTIQSIMIFQRVAPTHLLDLFRTLLLPDRTLIHQNVQFMASYYMDLNDREFASYTNIQELRSNGIRIKSNKKSELTDMSFSHGWLNGELKLPRIVLDDFTIPIFLNLIAYERCPDFNAKYGMGSFLAFLNSLVREPEDVKVLRSAGVLYRTYGSDEELVKLVHFLAGGIMSHKDTYAHIFVEMNKHITNKWKVNTVHFLKYIRHAWTSFAIHATELALALTFIQTWFTIHPAKSN
ncbi:UPF0481 protein At3g47200-like [Vicia villosa]|uniref:UPF0481 protein At3g47200-like n=1 Tax=Vicia villosa TaxID=3911 RepID=UPI00273BA4F0|nr:UPF0481 protein At3g47200-like [Vicia villosa]